MGDYKKVIGGGAPLKQCAEKLMHSGFAHDLQDIELIEYSLSKQPQTQLRKFADEHKLGYSAFNKSVHVNDALRNEKLKSLIFSISNTCIFPEDVVGKGNLDIVNKHSSLLPRHPGSGGMCWTIFHEDEQGGLTWHFVDEGIDSGDIIAQAAVNIPTGYDVNRLTRDCDPLIAPSFADILEPLLNQTAPRKKQILLPDRRVNGWKECPNSGILTPDDDIEYTHRILRGFLLDQNAPQWMLDLAPKLYIDHEGKLRQVVGYDMREAGMEARPEQIRITQDDKELVLDTLNK